MQNAGPGILPSSVGRATHTRGIGSTPQLTHAWLAGRSNWAPAGSLGDRIGPTEWVVDVCIVVVFVVLCLLVLVLVAFERPK